MAKRSTVKSMKTVSADAEMKLLGKRIQELRKQKGYTSYETFANEHDIHRVQWGRYESGSDLYFSTLVKICKVLDVSLEEFFNGFKK
jgi:transcriptional regulator with XRE-family HTH domain